MTMFSTGYSGIDNDITVYELPAEKKDLLEIKRTILLAVDESITSQYAFDYARKNLLRSDDCVCLVNVMPTNSPPPLESLDVGAMFIDTGYLEEQQKYNADHSKWLLKRYESFLQKYKVRLFSLLGDNRDEICRAATNLKADMAILGSRDLTGLHRMFLGSTTDYCLHNIECSVYVVKPPESLEFDPILGSDNRSINKKES
eukprot:NODE_249_length_11770_cov_0.803530.p6 type:complete len:201 gc:universal NODE_249_length_11770_cov_0.803530:6398-7000(+)